MVLAFIAVAASGFGAWRLFEPSPAKGKHRTAPAPMRDVTRTVSASGALSPIIVYVLALVLGIRMNWHLEPLCGVVFLVLLGAALFSTFSLIIACIVKTRERFMGIGQVLTMPLFFAGNAIYPTKSCRTG
jgi:ABC-type polysaccharide/polyol phosphate export permease